MKLLGIDIGSSSVKAGVLSDGALVGKSVRVDYPTRGEGSNVEIEPNEVLRAVATAIHVLGRRAKSTDAIALAAMAPSWVAMDARGRALTPIVTHQDRRAVAEAREIERRVGRKRHLKLAGNRPFPGGISSTTWLWFRQNRPQLLRRADLVGHVSTLLHRQLCGTRVVDPSNASFMGIYSTLDLSGWNDELCDAIGARPSQLPEIRNANEPAGAVTRDAATRFGLVEGTPVLTGLMDTGAALLLGGAKVGRIVNSCGSTDVLALCTDRPVPDERLLTRAVGVGRRWVSVATIAAAGSTIAWMKDRFFADIAWPAFGRMIKELAVRPIAAGITFEPYLAGDRASIEQRTAGFSGLTLATTRQAMLSAVIESLAAASAARLDLLREVNPISIHRNVCLTGGASAAVRQVLRRDWAGRWNFNDEHEATLRGLWRLEQFPSGRSVLV